MPAQIAPLEGGRGWVTTLLQPPKLPEPTDLNAWGLRPQRISLLQTVGEVCRVDRNARGCDATEVCANLSPRVGLGSVDPYLTAVMSEPGLQGCGFEAQALLMYGFSRHCFGGGVRFLRGRFCFQYQYRKSTLRSSVVVSSRLPFFDGKAILPETTMPHLPPGP